MSARWWRQPGVPTAFLLLLAFAASAAWSPRFLDARYLLDRSALSLETGLMAVAMTFVIVAGHIDLSCASILALIAALTAALHVKLGVPLASLLLLAPVLGALLGALNGVLVARVRLPSLAVTLATMALYRGVAQILLGDHSLAFPEWFAGVDRVSVLGSPLTAPVIAFLAVALVLGLVLHRTVWGEWVFALGQNPVAARYSGVPVARVTIGVFVLSGVLSALAGLLMASRLGVARYDHARGYELEVVTTVVLGGASIFGGRGTMFGTVVALACLVVVQTGMGIANLKPELQTAVLGALLIASVLVANATERRKS
jgi:rhamnose transport system permease protein